MASAFSPFSRPSAAIGEAPLALHCLRNISGSSKTADISNAGRVQDRHDMETNLLLECDEGEGFGNVDRARSRFTHWYLPYAEASCAANKRKVVIVSTDETASSGLNQKCILKRCMHGQEVQARPTTVNMQTLRRSLHLRARPTKIEMQGLRRSFHLRAQPNKVDMQGLRRVLHLRARPNKVAMQGLLRSQLRARPVQADV